MYVVATAGHVDHGKSALVRALTGMEPDRWADEQRRGMTIDLGFAWTTLDDGASVAFVDVPGHQRFVTNMLAGVGPTPAVMLVIAADQGWRQQTAEHVAALDALGVSHGVLAVTRSDLADPAEAVAEARRMLTETSLRDIEAVAVSAVTGAGIADLRDAIGRMVAELDPPATSAARLWIDRAFTVAGAGTVVTGTLGSGTIRTGDEMLLEPVGALVRVRGLQTLKETVPEVSGVARVAVNLRSVRKVSLRRGQALVTPGRWLRTDLVDVRLHASVDSLPREATLHVGSAAIATRIRMLGPDSARLQLGAFLPVHVGERGVLRDPGSARILAGVVVLDPAPPTLRRRGAAARRAIELAGVLAAPDPLGEVRRRGAVRSSQLVAMGHLDTAGAVDGAVAVDDWSIDPTAWDRWRVLARQAVDSWAQRHPLDPVVPLTELAARLELPDRRLVDRVVAADPELAVEPSGVRRRDAAPLLPPGVDAALTRIAERLSEDPFAAPDAAELAGAGVTESHLVAAARARRVLRVAQGIYLLPDAVDEARRRLAALPQPFTTSAARQALDTTRRVAIPLLEMLDRLGVTRRVDTVHRVMGRREQDPSSS